ncbi:prion-inhibition and propagation domain-containing protein [Trichoderma camerunense]
MDPVGNTIGLLRFVLNSFSQIQLAREFESEFERYQLKLDLIQLRLSRWGEVNNNKNIARKRIPVPSGRSGNPGNPTGNPTTQDLATPINGAEGLENPTGDPTTGILLEIQDTVAKAQRDARKIKNGTSSDQLLDADACIPADLRGLHNRFKGLIGRRTSQTVKVVDGLKWAFYKRDHFDRFISDISSLTDNLEGLLPEGDKQKLWELSSDECKGINKPNLEELKDIAQDCDPIIENASGEALSNARGGANHVTQTHNIGSVLGVNNGNFNVSGTHHWGRS